MTDEGFQIKQANLAPACLGGQGRRLAAELDLHPKQTEIDAPASEASGTFWRRRMCRLASLVSCFGKVGPHHHRPDRFLSPLFIQMTCGFPALFRFSPLPPNALRGNRKSERSLTIESR
jgi:hypothetical protein